MEPTLAGLGIGGPAERVYRRLVTTFDTDPAALARALDLTEAAVHGALRDLSARGLVRQVGDDPASGFLPAPPDVALGSLLQRRQQELDGARSAVGRLTDAYRQSMLRRDAAQLVEVITGRDPLRQQLSDLQLGAREELVAFCKAGYVAMPSADNSEQFEAMAAGVRCRIIYEQALLEEPGMLANLETGIAAGEEARSAPVLPVRLMIADRRLGVCPLVPTAEGYGEPTAALVRDSSLLEALYALFESYWERASPLHRGATDREPDPAESDRTEAGVRAAMDTDSASGPLAPAERRLLSLLVAGVTDKAIATELGISQRTVQRRIADLHLRTGARTRTQLAWQAARLDLLR